ncbi:secreted RxLR effector protein 161-like [Benincasa hispida]|uniref:secreted RxLR effector protein 161-like n=1 Tax=Benincasa hispida TaxID=102211 RepID=UPI0018FF7915|nr:secreted RxLR effector protein 161-like [Benincasa hispida]
MAEFEMTDLGMMHYFLGIKVIQSVVGIFINQKKYVLEILDRFQMENCNLATTPVKPNLKLTKDHEGKKVNSTLYKQKVGSLMYLIATRLDIMYVVSLISRFMESPTELHLFAAKRILRYLKRTPDLGILYQKEENLNLVGFSDSDYAGDLNDRKSTLGYVFIFGSGAISWSSKKQPIVTLSTTKAELVAATSCACQAIWLRNILENLHYKQEEASIIHCDNTSTIKLSRNLALHG